MDHFLGKTVSALGPKPIDMYLLGALPQTPGNLVRYTKLRSRDRVKVRRSSISAEQSHDLQHSLIGAIPERVMRCPRKIKTGHTVLDSGRYPRRMARLRHFVCPYT
jgi:hypothetical protein